MKYPVQNCTDVRLVQGSAFEVNAFAEWDRNMNANGVEVTEEADNKTPLYVGILKCFCDLEKLENKTFKSSDLFSGYRITTQKNSSEPICKNYFNEMS